MMIVFRLADTTCGYEELFVRRGACSYHQNVQSLPAYNRSVMQPPTGKCMHLGCICMRVRIVEGGLATWDCGVVAAYTQQLRWGFAMTCPLIILLSM